MGLPGLHCTFLSKPGGRAAWGGNSQVPASYPSAGISGVGGRSPASQTSHSGMETIETFLQQENKSYLCSSFLIFRGKISINHYPQACVGSNFSNA